MSRQRETKTARSSPVLTILIADRDPSFVRTTVESFERANFEVRASSNAQECLDAFNSMDKVDLVLLGDSIAGEEAIDVIVKIRRVKLDQRILAVVKVDSTRARAMKLGADVAVITPLDAEAVVRRAQQLLAQDDSFKNRQHARLKDSETS